MELDTHQNLFAKLVIIVTLCLSLSEGKIDEIKLEDDQRSSIHLVSFGMFVHAELDVNLTLKVELNGDKISRDINKSPTFGLSIGRTSQSTDQEQQQYSEVISDGGVPCFLDPEHSRDIDNKNILFRFNISGQSVDVQKLTDMVGVELTSRVPPKSAETGNTTSTKKPVKREADPDKETLVTDKSPDSSKPTQPTTVKAGTDGSGTASHSAMSSAVTYGDFYAVPSMTASGKLPLNVTTPDGLTYYISFNFKMTIVNESDPGYYSLYFHNCVTQRKEIVPITLLEAVISGYNVDQKSYLSAGDIPEPYLFFALCIIYVILSCIWLKVLKSAKSGVFKTHYLMLAVCYCKALSALFHGTNYYYMGKNGREETAWAVIYYISYLMKTVLLFLTIMLVGSGWAFIKHVFSDKEKKLFLVAIPLQLLVYIAYVILSETEVAAKDYSTWHTISIVVDLLCCAAILLPVIWSIRHLQEASASDGKAALNLQKLKLFKTLYILIIAYIYITRVVFLIFKMTLPYNLSWLNDCFTEIVIILFLTMLGYKFRPADDNPYFQVPPDSDDEEQLEMAVTQSGVGTEMKKRVFVKAESDEDVEKQSLISNRHRSNESSHDLD